MAKDTTKDALVEGTSLWSDAWKRLRKNRAAMVSFFILVFITLMAIGYEGVAAYITGYEMDEQNAFVVPKPPGSRSVPKVHMSLTTEGRLAFEAVDANGDGALDAKEVFEAYKRWEFDTLDTNGDGVLDFDEYWDAPLSVPPPESFTPNCEQWSVIKRSLASIQDGVIFGCDAGEDLKMQFEEAGKLIEITSLGESQDILARLSADGDALISRDEYRGLPQPRIHALGTDQLGRDLLTRTVYGARISLAVGFLATIVSFLIGVTWGATAGFLGGKIDNIMMRIVDIMYGLPFMFLVILLMVVFGQKIFLLFIALGAIQWLTMARIVRGQVISLKNQEFVEAAETIGVSSVGIIFKHLIPNALGPIIVYATLTVPAVMLEEAFLSFLGLGVQAPQTSWGALISEGRQLMDSAPWLIIYPGLALAVTLLSLNFLGDGLRDALDPQLRKD